MKTLGIIAFLSLLLGPCTAMHEREQPAPAPHDELAQALAVNREAWVVSGLDSYTYTLSRVCLCPESELGPFQITVYERDVVHVEWQGEQIDPDSQAFYSVPALFDLVDRAITDGADMIKVEYDSVLGYPTQIFIDWDISAADEETIVAAENLAPLVE